MTGLEVKLDGDNCFPDLREKGFVRGELVAVARLPMSTSEGRSTVAFRVELPDGQTALAETYAREPGFYGSTYCCSCRMHRPVGAGGEFV